MSSKAKGRICEICGVRERQKPAFFANFPIDEQRCRTWVQIVGKEDLVNIPIEKLHQGRFVCRDHFKAKDFNKKGNRLKKRAYPWLQLSAQPLSDHQLKDFPQHVASKGRPAENTGKIVTNVVTLEKVHNDHAYTKRIVPHEWAVEVQDDKKEEKKVDSNIQEADNPTKAAIFDNDDLPLSPEPEFTTEIVSDIGENIIDEDSTEKQVFSWQNTELIEADESEDVTSAAVSKQPKTYEDLTLSLFCDELETLPLSPEPCELVAVVPEEVESRCKDCASVIVGFSFWCLQCRRGAMCCACATSTPHDAHYVLRVPRGAAENRTLEILTVIRQQLLNENWLTQYEIDEDGLKVEVKQEPEECPSPPPQPAATPDPLAVESHPRPCDVELQDDMAVESHPDLLGDEPRSDDVFDECLGEKYNGHYHYFRRPRLLEHSLTLKSNSTATKNHVKKCSTLNVPTNIVQEPPTVRTLPCDPSMSQNDILATTSESSGSQTALNITTSDPSGPQPVIEVTPSALKELQRFLLATTTDPGISKDILNAITSDLKGILQVISCDQIELKIDQHVKPNYLDGSETVQQVDLSQLGGSDVVLEVDPSDPTGSQTVLHIDPSKLNVLLTNLQNQTSEKLGSKTALQVDSSDEQDVLLVSYSDPKRSQTVMQIDPGDLNGLPKELKATDSNPKGSNSAHIYPSDIRQSPHLTKTGSQTVVQAASNRTGSQFLQKTVSSDRIGPQTPTKTTLSIGARVLKKVSPSNCSASQSLPTVTASGRTESELVMMRTREMSQGSDFSGPETYKKIQPKILKKIQSVLKLEKVQSIPKGAAIIQLIDNEPKKCFKVPQYVTRGVSVPLKVTSGTKSAETVITNLDDSDMESVEFLEEESEETGLDKVGLRKDEDSMSEIQRVVNEHVSKKRKVENRTTSHNATSDKANTTMITNLDDVDIEAVEFLEEESEETGLDKVGYRKYEDSITEIQRVVNEHVSNKIKLENGITSDKASSGKANTTMITSLDDVDIEAVEFLEEESEETGLDKVGYRKDSITEIQRVVNEHLSKKRTVENRITSDKATSDKVSENELEDDGNFEDIENTRADTASVIDVGSEVDDSDLDKDYAVEDDKLEESTDDTDVESIAERGVARRTRNATKTPAETPSQAMLRMLTSKAVVQVKPLTSLEIRKWMANRKRPRKD